MTKYLTCEYSGTAFRVRRDLMAGYFVVKDPEQGTAIVLIRGAALNRLLLTSEVAERVRRGR